MKDDRVSRADPVPAGQQTPSVDPVTCPGSARDPRIESHDRALRILKDTNPTCWALLGNWGEANKSRPKAAEGNR